MHIPNWMNEFITYDIESDEWIAWDETQSRELGRFDTKKLAAEAITEYDKTLER